MNLNTCTTLNRAAHAAALAIILLVPSACTDDASSPGAPGATNGSASSPSGVRPPSGTQTNGVGSVTPAGAPGQLAPGTKNRIEGRVINLVCFRENPSATPEVAAECAKQQLAANNGALAILGTDNIVYVSDSGLKTANEQLGAFIGPEIVADGTVVADAPDQVLSGVTVKRLQIRFVRKKVMPPRAPGGPKLVGPPKIGTEPTPAAPARRP
jgi:hypothetical protein